MATSVAVPTALPVCVGPLDSPDSTFCGCGDAVCVKRRLCRFTVSHTGSSQVSEAQPMGAKLPLCAMAFGPAKSSVIFRRASTVKFSGQTCCRSICCTRSCSAAAAVSTVTLVPGRGAAGAACASCASLGTCCRCAAPVFSGAQRFSLCGLALQHFDFFILRENSPFESRIVRRVRWLLRLLFRDCAKRCCLGPR